MTSYKDIKKVNILGIDYNVSFKKQGEDKILDDRDFLGYTDTTVKEIVILVPGYDADISVKNVDYEIKQVIRHEIVHAYMHESGLRNGSTDWADNESCTDWIAMQFNKMLKTFEKAEVL